MSSNPSICIPRCVSPNLNVLSIVFSKFGYVKNIQIYKLKVVINYDYWFDNDYKVKNIINRLNSEQPVNIVYDFPWYWRCFKCTH